MVDTKISALTAGTPLAADTFPFQRGGTANFSMTRDVLATSIAGTIATQISGTVAGQMAGSGITGQKLIWNAGTVKWIDDDFAVTYLITSPIGTTLYPPFECGFNGTIEALRLNSGTVLGNGTVDIYKMTYAQVGTGTPGTAFSIVGTATKPALAGTQLAEVTTFTGWTATTFSKGDWIYPYVTGAGTIVNLSVSISGRKTAVS
jgi:hypothetical protein